MNLIKNYKNPRKVSLCSHELTQQAWVAQNCTLQRSLGLTFDQLLEDDPFTVINDNHEYTTFSEFCESF